MVVLGWFSLCSLSLGENTLLVFSYRQGWFFTAGSKVQLLVEGGGFLVPGSSRVTQTRLPRTFRMLYDSWKRP